MATRISYPNQLKWAWLPCAAVAMLALMLNPIGYIGGHNDDAQYLEAARCWVAAAKPCLPATHWATRWPAIAPIALASHWLGESRVTIGIAVLPWWILATVLIGWLGRLWFDQTTGLVAAAILATTPVFTQSALQPNVDIIELALQLAALVAAAIAFRNQRRLPALVAGIFAALAVQARDTSFLFCAAAALAWLTLDREPRRILLWSLVGFGLAMAVEMLVYWQATGDFLFRYSLALHHGAIATDELPAGFDTSRSPLFDRAYIANWRREMGIVRWWPIDPWLNLLASPRIGFVLVGAMVLGAATWRWMARPVRRRIAIAVVAAVLVAMLLVYALAIDPKPRMFLLLVAVAALTCGASVSVATRANRGLVPQAAVGLLLCLGLVTLTRFNTTRECESLAARWMSQYRGHLSLDPNALSTLALVPGTAALPTGELARDLRISGGNEPCRHYLGTTVAQSAVTGGGQLCLQDMRGLRPAIVSTR